MAGKCRTGNEQAKGRLIPAKHGVVMTMKTMVDLVGFFVLLSFAICFFTVKMFTDEMLKVLMIHIQTFTKLIPEPVFQKSLQESREEAQRRAIQSHVQT